MIVNYRSVVGEVEEVNLANKYVGVLFFSLRCSCSMKQERLYSAYKGEKTEEKFFSPWCLRGFFFSLSSSNNLLSVKTKQKGTKFSPPWNLVQKQHQQENEIYSIFDIDIESCESFQNFMDQLTCDISWIYPMRLYEITGEANGNFFQTASLLVCRIGSKKSLSFIFELYCRMKF